MTPEDRAQRSADIMWESDHAAQWLGLRLTEVGEGRSAMEFTVAAEHCNGHGICHGGLTFALADTAFAYACNSRNQRTVAQHNVISYIAPGKLGDVLTATAREVTLNGRSGIYDVAVHNQAGDLIAEFRGMSRMIKGQFFDEEA